MVRLWGRRALMKGTGFSQALMKGTGPHEGYGL